MRKLQVVAGVVSRASIAVAILALAGGAAEAEGTETLVICKEALAQPVAAAGCATVGVILNELFADRPFGPNGAIMGVLTAPVTIALGNIKGAERESGDVARVLRALTGVSVRDIQEYGIWGGSNSIFRKPLGTLGG